MINYGAKIRKKPILTAMIAKKDAKAVTSVHVPLGSFFESRSFFNPDYALGFVVRV